VQVQSFNYLKHIKLKLPDPGPLRAWALRAKPARRTGGLGNQSREWLNSRD